MTGYTVHTGSSEEFASGLDLIFRENNKKDQNPKKNSPKPKEKKAKKK
jgi:hypothetical protein